MDLERIIWRLLYGDNQGDLRRNITEEQRLRNRQAGMSEVEAAGEEQRAYLQELRPRQIQHAQREREAADAALAALDESMGGAINQVGNTRATVQSGLENALRAPGVPGAGSMVPQARSNPTLRTPEFDPNTQNRYLDGTDPLAQARVEQVADQVARQSRNFLFPEAGPVHPIAGQRPPTGPFAEAMNRRGPATVQTASQTYTQPQPPAPRPAPAPQVISPPPGPPPQARAPVQGAPLNPAIAAANQATPQQIQALLAQQAPAVLQAANTTRPPNFAALQQMAPQPRTPPVAQPRQGPAPPPAGPPVTMANLAPQSRPQLQAPVPMNTGLILPPQGAPNPTGGVAAPNQNRPVVQAPAGPAPRGLYPAGDRSRPPPTPQVSQAAPIQGQQVPVTPVTRQPGPTQPNPVQQAQPPVAPPPTPVRPPPAPDLAPPAPQPPAPFHDSLEGARQFDDMEDPVVKYRRWLLSMAKPNPGGV